MRRWQFPNRKVYSAIRFKCLYGCCASNSEMIYVNSRAALWYYEAIMHIIALLPLAMLSLSYMPDL